MKMYEFLKLQPEAFALQKAFIEKFKQSWNIKESVIELDIQIGHLCQSLINNQRLSLKVDAHNQPNRILNNISDELCDCFLSVCSIYSFLEIKNTELLDVSVDENYSYDEVIVQLLNLSSQLLDSCMIYLKIKPAFKRDERKMFLEIYFKIVSLLVYLADLEKIDIIDDFSKMVSSAYKFLQNSEK